MHGNAYSGRGWPDIIGCYCGLFFGLEVKCEGSAVTPLQVERLNQIRDAGGVASIVRSIDDLIELGIRHE